MPNDPGDFNLNEPLAAGSRQDIAAFPSWDTDFVFGKGRISMEVIFEQLIETYLTRGGKVFVAPQYSIPAPGSNSDWACPDFVALDFERREVVVVEITTGSDIGPITKKAKDRDNQWFDRVRKKLDDDGVAIGWTIRFLGFVRHANLRKARDAVAGHDGVAFEAIEVACFPWIYWDGREKGGLPR